MKIRKDEVNKKVEFSIIADTREEVKLLDELHEMLISQGTFEFHGYFDHPVSGALQITKKISKE